MDFSEVIGQKHLQSHLLTTIENGRIPHAQLFIGKAGTGVLPAAIAYANAILCSAHTTGSEAYSACTKQTANFAHPDLHFVYPVNTNDTIKKHPVSDKFSDEWREFLKENPYGSLFQWFQKLGIEKKQGMIRVDEAADMMKKLSLKSYQGGYKVMIVWMADKMNTECGNKILKLIEEPPKKTVLLLLTEDEQQIMGTIQSRCQKLHFPLLSEEDTAHFLMNKHQIDENTALKIAHRANGDANRALQLASEDGDDLAFERLFIDWVRTAFKAKGNKNAINSLLKWSDTVAALGRETQKKFLVYCIEVFRQALLKNYKAEDLLFFEAEDPKFSLEKFAPFVHQNNIFEITQALEDAAYHIERNGNAKIIFTDLSISLTRYIHKKELV
ncbi:DNA polymerase III subunit [Marixanthomonas spongiae]|uniref:DNA polymerase III subunit delta n=1 Tax=Marixanthomonas spongiae TaxID=2174845 RepID=A0A2U0I226_9FLAO|nr:DNA polymerase III subunit delta' [Marixanthomonas spongiae]PVW15156.1 DNA polymerase III subunit delta' [Marixanthomonas spongiae]